MLLSFATLDEYKMERTESQPDTLHKLGEGRQVSGGIAVSLQAPCSGPQFPFLPASTLSHAGVPARHGVIFASFMSAGTEAAGERGVS